ncbi:unnamed protein product [Lymnaea stagnalis]|uniref:UspA domain-containing protein n=1 Tax=Lymnaea stagnalis TaxID=6523 RepID=A0AAV2HZX7_LYMST
MCEASGVRFGDVVDNAGAQAEEGVVVPRRVLVGMDGSADADQAFDWYIENIFLPTDYVIIGYCPAAGSAFHFDGFFSNVNSHVIEFQEKVSHVKEALENKLKQTEAHGVVKILGGTNAGNSLIKEAEKENVELIVVGSRGHGVLRRTVLGSVSGYVVHHSHVPVLVYPPMQNSNVHHGYNNNKVNEQQNKTRDSTTEDKHIFVKL